MKSFKKLFHGLCVVFAMSASSHALADATAPTPFSANFDFYVGGLPIAEISLAGSIGTFEYAANSTVRTRGLLDIWLNGRMKAATVGHRHTKGHLAPDRYNTDYTTRSDARTVSMAYSGEVANVSITPPEERKPYDTHASKHPDTLDPLTAAVTMMSPREIANLCNRTIPVFDGKRRYDLILLPLDRRPSGETPPSPNWKRPTIHCFGVYERIAGFEGDLQGAQRYFPFDVWFEQNEKDGLHHIVRLAGKTKLGFAIGTLRE